MNKDYEKILALIKSPKIRPTLEASISLKALREQVKKMTDLGYRPEQIGKIQNLAMDAIKLDLIENNKMEVIRLESNLATIKNSWQKDYEDHYSKNARTIEDSRRRFNAMTIEELEAEADKVLSGNYTLGLPAIYDELSIALKNSNSEKFGDLRQAIKSNNLLEPWLAEGLGKELTTDIDYLQNNLQNVVLKDVENHTSIMGIDDINDFLDFEEKEAENGE